MNATTQAIIDRLPKTCLICGAEFMPRKRRQKFCSRRCANSTRVSERKPTVCPVCGQTFIPSAQHPETRYCSRSCANQAIAAAARIPPRACAWCGKEFKPRAWVSRYCSPECQYGARRHRERCRLENEDLGLGTEPQSAIVNLQSSIAKVRAYLSLTPAERYARRSELTKQEHKLAQRIYEEDHSYRCVAVNW